MNNNVTPFLSVCCITFNHAHYIRECLDGFIIQKTNFPIEILIYDDASTDGAQDIIREYERNYPDIIKPIYQTENQYSKGVKVGAVYNYSRAKGKYIALCEGDDYWTDPLKLQKQVDFLEANPEYGMTYTKAQPFSQATTEYSKITIGEDRKNLHDLLLIGNAIPTLTVLIRKNIIDSYLLTAYKDIQIQELPFGDYSLWLYTAGISKINFGDEITAVYRVLLNSASHSSDILKVLLFEDAVLKCRIYFDNYFQCKIKDEIVNNGIKRIVRTFIDKVKHERLRQIINKYSPSSIECSVYKILLKNILTAKLLLILFHLKRITLKQTRIQDLNINF